MNKFLISIALFAALSTLTSCFECEKNTANWCQSLETAKQCNVVEQCHKYVWSHRTVRTIYDSSELVNITLYYEVLCADCRVFISNEVYKAFTTVGNIMNISFVPYGNAKEVYNETSKLYEYTCQHGESECWGNMFHTCLIHVYPKIEVIFPFIYCMESSQSFNGEDIHDVAKRCSEQTSIPIDQVLDCTNNSLGNSLVHEMAVRTENLRPQHQYVPWLTLNEIHTEDIQKKAQDDLVGLVCENFNGSPIPDACKTNN